MKKISLVILLLTFLGCTKLGKNLTVKGKVINPITGVGIPDVTLKLQRTTLDLPGGYKTVKSTTTDANGDFEISKFGLNSYDLQCDLGDYYPIGWYEDGEKAEGTLFRLHVRKRKTMHVEFHAVEYGCLQYHVENQNCEGSTDSMIYRMKYQYDNDFLPLWSFATIGCFNTVFSGCTKLPMGNHIFEIKVFRPSGVTHFFDTVFVSGSGTTLYHQVY